MSAQRLPAAPGSCPGPDPGRVDGDRSFGKRVVLCVAHGHLPGHLPATDVVPSEAPGNDRDALGLFHDAVVNRNRGERWEDLGDHGH